MLVVPLLRESQPIGALSLAKTEVQPFTDKQIELVTTFADQAVIAIENTRLFEEVQARTRELQESLKYQTATSDVLGVISRSPNQLLPVLDAMITAGIDAGNGGGTKHKHRAHYEQGGAAKVIENADRFHGSFVLEILLAHLLSARSGDDAFAESLQCSRFAGGAVNAGAERYHVGARKTFAAACAGYGVGGGGSERWR